MSDTGASLKELGFSAKEGQSDTVLYVPVGSYRLHEPFIIPLNFTLRGEMSKPISKRARNRRTHR